ncbi:hypothetical protein EGI22_22950 [Lacihabitans sp. LS3-19]|uniref:hypothetical protein n=1 Tax=Lacihabitans sp. LS3-19 TaxID=2487335 RepID=UPI0020CED59A|nr:hypothetical protein [Lacihabitans sp. LS3-19]MCP9770773.1 hypothetical protein [Lacihabitans sp. LS3-19]
MKNLAKFTLILFVFSACQSAKDAAQEGINSALEEAIESQTGQEVDLAKVDSYLDQKVEVSLEFDGKEQIEDKQAFRGSIIAQKSAEDLNVSFQIVNESGTSVMGVISNFNTNFSLPLEAKFAVSNAKTEGVPSASLVFMKISETGMQATPMPFEGTMRILKLNEDIAEFEIDAKGGLPQDTENSNAWKSIKGKVSITSPPIQCLGLKKEEIIK